MPTMSPISSRIRNPATIWIILAALFSFTIASLFNLFAGVAAGVVGGVLWWGLIERPAKPTLLRGGAFGFLTVLLAQPLMWILGAVFGHPIFASILNQTNGSPNSLSDLTLILRDLAFGSIIGLIFISFTIPLGVVAGLVLVLIRRKFQ